MFRVLLCDKITTWLRWKKSAEKVPFCSSKYELCFSLTSLFYFHALNNMTEKGAKKGQWTWKLLESWEGNASCDLNWFWGLWRATCGEHGGLYWVAQKIRHGRLGWPFSCINSVLFTCLDCIIYFMRRKTQRSYILDEYFYSIRQKSTAPLFFLGHLVIYHQTDGD